MNSFTLAQGRRFAWREDGQGEPICLIHGWGNSSAIFIELMAELRDFHTYAPDLPGYGDSSPAEEFNLDTLASDFICWLDKLGTKKIHLIGWSLGGIIAQHLAATSPSRVKTLTLIASTPRFTSSSDWPHGLSQTAVRSLARNYNRAPAQTLENFWSLQFQGERHEPPARIPYIDPPSALKGLKLLQEVDLRKSLKSISAPSIIIHGSRDVIIPSDAGRYLATALPSSSYYEIPECGHAPFLNHVPTVGNLIRPFLL